MLPGFGTEVSLYTGTVPLKSGYFRVRSLFSPFWNDAAYPYTVLLFFLTTKIIKKKKGPKHGYLIDICRCFTANLLTLKDSATEGARGIEEKLYIH